MKAAYANTPVQITLGEAALEPAAAQRVTSILVRQRLSAPSVAEITFAEPPDDVVDGLRFGATVKLVAGADTALFEGEVTAIEHQRDGAQGRIVRVRAYDKLHRLRKKQRARVAQETSISKFLADSVAEIGIDCDPVETGPTRGLIVQYEQNDLDLLTALAADAGLFFFLDRGTLRLMSLAGHGGEAMELKVGRDLSIARATANAESMRRATAAKAWDVLHTEVVDASVLVARQDTNDMHALDASAFGDVGKRTLFNRLAGNGDEAEALAQADMDRSAARDVVIDATAVGNPDIRPGALVNVQGLSSNIDGHYTVTTVEHTITEASGFLTAFSTAPPAIARGPGGCPAFTFGVVTDVDDPEKLSRVKAKFPLLGDVEGTWMPVVIPGAGLDKGLAVLPEVDDEVLIVFPQGDPAYGLVLGGLYGRRKSPGLVDGGTRPFAFRTKNGQAITLDADKGLARIETSGGDVLELGPDGTRVHATRDLLIEAPGRKLTIRANTVEFERG